MERLMHLAQVLVGDMGVYLRGTDIGVAEEGLHMVVNSGIIIL